MVDLAKYNTPPEFVPSGVIFLQIAKKRGQAPLRLGASPRFLVSFVVRWTVRDVSLLERLRSRSALRLSKRRSHFFTEDSETVVPRLVFPLFVQEQFP